MARGAGQPGDGLFLDRAFGQEQGLDQLALAKADLGHHVAQCRGGAQSLQSLHCWTSWRNTSADRKARTRSSPMAARIILNVLPGPQPCQAPRISGLAWR